MIITAASMVVGGLAWRVRGAAEGSTPFSIISSGIVVRVLAALAIVLIPALTQSLWLLALGATLFGGMCLAGWGDDFDIGRNGGNRVVETLRMCRWGSLAVAPSMIAILPLGGSPWPLLLAGLAFGPVYAGCWQLAHRLPAIPRLATGPTEWAEIICGALIAGAIALAGVAP